MRTRERIVAIRLKEKLDQNTEFAKKAGISVTFKTKSPKKKEGA